MKTIIIEIRDNPQGKDLTKLIKEIKEKFLDWGLIVNVSLGDES